MTSESANVYPIDTPGMGNPAALECGQRVAVVSLASQVGRG